MPATVRLDGVGNLVRKFRDLRGRYKGQPKVAVGYSQEYAVYVHENLEAYHPTGTAKFLERPARQYRAEMGRMVRTRMRKGGTTLRQALEEVGRFLMRKSQELVPVDTGALRNSAFTVVE